MLLRRSAVLLPMLLAAVVLCGCATFRTAEKSVNKTLFTPQQETALGSEYAQQIEAELTFLDDPQLSAWLDDMGSRLVAHSPETAQSFRFRITASPEVNAFAIPGGFCYVNAGLISYAANEAQVAAVVGHEINHVTTRHGLLSLQRAMGVNLLMEYLVPNEAGVTAQMAQLAAQSGGFLVTRKFGRDDEREADRLGVQAMYHAGYDPREAAGFFQRLNELSAGHAPGAFETMISTHPPTPERIQNIRDQVAAYDLDGRGLTVDSPDFRAIQAKVRSLVPEVPK